ncbi:hypothetical protein DF268_26805 [Streptomyces sp. V2]|nr:hypothetical protein DF268_26805 [Streptomyces sp. V2]
MARDHGFGCDRRMQGQMHVHVTEMSRPWGLLVIFSANFSHNSPSRLAFTPPSFRVTPPVSFGFFPSL